MHELSITENLLEIAIRHAEKAGAKNIRDLHLVIGQLASIVDDSVQFYWDIIAKDTIAENAQLHFKRIPTEFQCLDCKKTFSPSSNSFLCHYCKSSNIKILAGREFFLESIEIE